MLRFEWPAKKGIVLGFQHGRYADAWSLLHLSTGATVGVMGLLLKLDYVTAATLGLALFFAYELWEAAVDIVEDVENSLSDVVFGFAGLSLAYMLLMRAGAVSTDRLLPVFAIFAVLDVLLLFTGWKMFLRDRALHKPKQFLPSPRTVRGMRQIRRDRFIFLLALVCSLPLPWLIGKIFS